MLSPESAALRHVFQAERAASHILDVPNDTPTRPIRKVGIIGAGTMGGGISMSLINAGIPVVLLEMKQEALDKGLATMRRNYGGALKKGTLTEAALDQRMALVTPTLDYAQLKDVDLVIEAVFESMEVKKEVFEKLDQVVRQGAILASNTSALNLDQIAKFTKRPQDVIGLHFFSPANVMRLLEIVRGAKTAKDVLATAMQLAKKIGKVAVDFRRLRWIHRQSHGGALRRRRPRSHHGRRAAATRSTRRCEEFGMAMGPFRMSDLAGLDIGWAARKRRRAEYPDRDLSNVADELCEAGRFGQKTGAGFYRYEAGSRNAIPDPSRHRDHREVPASKRASRRARYQRGDRRALHLRADQRRCAHRRGWHRAAQLGHRYRVSQWLWLSAVARRPHVLCRSGGIERGGARSEGHRRAAARRQGILDSGAAARAPCARKVRHSAHIKDSDK